MSETSMMPTYRGARSVNFLNRVQNRPLSLGFNPAEFIGPGWGFWRGERDGSGLTGKLDWDSRSLTFTHKRLARVQLISSLERGTFCKDAEILVSGERTLERLWVANCIPLNLSFFEVLWKNKNLIPLLFQTTHSMTRIFFDAQSLRSPDGERCTLCMYFEETDGNCKWEWETVPLRNLRNQRDLSAVIILQ